jgi:hypothetical protein
MRYESSSRVAFLDMLAHQFLRRNAQYLSWAVRAIAQTAIDVSIESSRNAFFEWASAERVDTLIGRNILLSQSVTEDSKKPWRERVTAEIAFDAMRQRETVELARDWCQQGIHPLFLKGAALAYTHYEHSWERPRDDIDVWCADSELTAACTSLEARGYRLGIEPAGDSTLQRHYLRRDGAVEYQVELHLRIANPRVFADALSFDEAHAAARPIPQLDGALGLCPVHALLVACVHLVAHHVDSPRLVWLYDIHLLAGALSDAEWSEFTALATRARMRAVCAAAIGAAAAAFGTDIAPHIESIGNDAGDEPSRHFLRPSRREVETQWSNFRHAAGWRERAVLLRDRAFPPAAFMFAQYGAHHRLWLPLLYARRMVSRLPAWFRQPGTFDA